MKTGKDYLNQFKDFHDYIRVLMARELAKAENLTSVGSGVLVDLDGNGGNRSNNNSNNQNKKNKGKQNNQDINSTLVISGMNLQLLELSYIAVLAAVPPLFFA